MTENRWTEADVPDQSGRVAIVTGANTGLGFDTARVLAENGAIVVLAVRDTQKGADAAERIRATAPRADLRVQKLDLGSLTSVRSAAESLRVSFPRIDLLINNAGLLAAESLSDLDFASIQRQMEVNAYGPLRVTHKLSMLLKRGSKVALKRVGKPEDVAGVYVFLASDESGYCTGAEFVCDGGATATHAYGG